MNIGPTNPACLANGAGCVIDLEQSPTTFMATDALYDMREERMESMKSIAAFLNYCTDHLDFLTLRLI